MADFVPRKHVPYFVVCTQNPDALPHGDFIKYSGDDFVITCIASDRVCKSSVREGRGHMGEKKKQAVRGLRRSKMERNGRCGRGYSLVETGASHG